jgi:hypothetical protein
MMAPPPVGDIARADQFVLGVHAHVSHHGQQHMLKVENRWCEVLEHAASNLKRDTPSATGEQR